MGAGDTTLAVDHREPGAPGAPAQVATCGGDSARERVALRRNARPLEVRERVAEAGQVGPAVDAPVAATRVRSRRPQRRGARRGGADPGPEAAGALDPEHRRGGGHTVRLVRAARAAGATEAVAALRHEPVRPPRPPAQVARVA